MWDINATPKVCNLLVYNTLIYYVHTFYTGCKDIECQDSTMLNNNALFYNIHTYESLI